MLICCIMLKKQITDKHVYSIDWIILYKYYFFLKYKIENSFTTFCEVS